MNSKTIVSCSALLLAACGSGQPPCTSNCATAGDTQCVASQIETCQKGGNGCLTWSAPANCPGGAGVEFCDPAQQRCASCTNTCPTAGATQCSGAQVQTCTTNAQGCLGWSVASSCPSGQACDPDSNGCGDICQSPAVRSACQSAATNLNQCCAGGLAPATAQDLCEAFKKAGQDPENSCSALATTDCASLHRQFMTASSPSCCCPADQFCDYTAETPWLCVPSCKSAADCAAASTASARPACTPDNTSQGAIASSTMICRSNYAQLWGGCNQGSDVCCPSGTDCIEDGNGNEYCAPPCNGAQACTGDPSVACCSALWTCANCIESCASAKYCMPCQ